MKLLAACLALLLAAPLAAIADPVRIVAAENVYGDLARQIGGPDVAVTSILSNPNQDPHLFEASPTTARRLAAAHIVIANGIGYDPWMDKLLAATPSSQRRTLVVAALIGRKPGDNPHLWYDPAAMPALAEALADALVQLDPAHAAAYRQRLAAFRQSLQPVQAKIAALRTRVAGLPVTATEPVLGDLFAALGLVVRNEPFQLAVMNDTEPSARDVAAFETDLKTRQVRLLAYNVQAAGPIAERMVAMARRAKVPVVAASETEPASTSYQAWLLATLRDIEHALAP